jgi:hypothetical protein
MQVQALQRQASVSDDIRAENSLWMAEQTLGLHEISWFGTEGCGDHLQEAHLTILDNTTRETSGGDLEKLGESSNVSIVNTSQGVDRCSPMSSIMPCITTSGKYFVLDKNRHVLAEELMIMQGFPMTRVDVGANSRAELRRIAGNAMQAHSLGAAILTMFSLLDRKAFEKTMNKLRMQSGKKRKVAGR